MDKCVTLLEFTILDLETITKFFDLIGCSDCLVLYFELKKIAQPCSARYACNVNFKANFTIRNKESNQIMARIKFKPTIKFCTLSCLPFRITMCLKQFRNSLLFNSVFLRGRSNSPTIFRLRGDSMLQFVYCYPCNDKSCLDIKLACAICEDDSDCGCSCDSGSEMNGDCNNGNDWGCDPINFYNFKMAPLIELLKCFENPFCDQISVMFNKADAEFLIKYKPDCTFSISGSKCLTYCGGIFCVNGVMEFCSNSVMCALQQFINCNLPAATAGFRVGSDGYRLVIIVGHKIEFSCRFFELTSC